MSGQWQISSRGSNPTEVQPMGSTSKRNQHTSNQAIMSKNIVGSPTSKKGIPKVVESMIQIPKANGVVDKPNIGISQNKGPEPKLVAVQVQDIPKVKSSTSLYKKSRHREWKVECSSENVSSESNSNSEAQTEEIYLQVC